MSGNRRFFLLAAVIVAVCLVLFGAVYASSEAAQNELRIEGAKSLLQVGIFGVLGAYAKYLLEEQQKNREKLEHERQKQLEKLEKDRQQQIENLKEEHAAREAQHKLRLEALNLVTSSYWQVKKAFHIIDAHKSAKSYGEQMRLMIDYRLQLQRLDNEISAGLYALDGNDAIADNLYKMHELLGEVIDEWKDNYLRLAQLQKVDEDRLPEEKQMPHELASLPRLNAIRQDNFDHIHTLFENVVNPIRAQLRQEVGSAYYASGSTESA